LYWIQAHRLGEGFPDPGDALREPDGLLAAGGDLSNERLLDAYQRGIFPWYTDGQPILWWAPDPRSVLCPDELHVTRSLRRTLARGTLTVTIDRAFANVIRECAAPRRDDGGTWITGDMTNAYNRLHAAGYAHSVETWQQGTLVGGLYGVAIGKVFFGESMFARQPDASKVALARLVDRLRDWGYELIDCQVHNAHLESLGARTIARTEFNGLLEVLCPQRPSEQAWRSPDD
jgi:leucyl/phenylalanyl-tRNA--protein transferase